MLLDTSGLLAALDSSQRLHGPCAAALKAARGPLWLSPFVLAELDYVLSTRVGHQAQLAWLGEVARGAYRLEPFGADDIAAARSVIERYSDQEIGLADASLVVLAGRRGDRDILTLDRRQFSALKRPNGRPFRIVPD